MFDQGAKWVIFLPDEFLGRNTAAEMGVAFVAAAASDTAPNPELERHERAVIGWNARCEVHELFTVEDIERARQQFPDVIILAHPECSPEVIAKVDVAGSTKQMLDYIKNLKSGRLLLLTECSMADNIAAESRHLELLRLCNLRCPHMAQITLEDTLAALKNIQYKVELPADIVERARSPIDRMLSIR